MMLQNVNIALSVVLCGCLLSGCNNSTTSASSSVSSPSTSDYESSSAATSNLDSYEDEEPTSAVPSSTQPPTEEPNTPDSSEPSASPAQPEQEYTDLSFLSEEQRQLYTNAYDASFGLYIKFYNEIRPHKLLKTVPSVSSRNCSFQVRHRGS